MSQQAKYTIDLNPLENKTGFNYTIFSPEGAEHSRGTRYDTKAGLMKVMKKTLDRLNATLIKGKTGWVAKHTGLGV